MRPMLSGIVLSSQTDERLVALTRDGHDQAFVAIAERYRRELMAHARRLAPRGRCEDIVQQAMLSAWDALRHEADVRDARAWLHRIVHNAALSVARSSMDHERLSESFAAPAGTEGEVERRLAATEALAALTALPEPQRRAVELTAIVGRSGREAAGELGMSEGALRQLVHRARATLRSGATALVPMPLVMWAAGGTNETLAGRIGEICAGAGMAVTVTKVGAAVAVTATLIGGATQVLPSGSAHPAHRQQAGAHRQVSSGGARAVTGTGLGVKASAASAAPIEHPQGGRRGVDRQGQQQAGSATDANGQSHQTGADQRTTGASNSGGSGARRTSGNNRASENVLAQTNHGGLGSQNAGAAGPSRTGAKGLNSASGANQP